MPWSHPPDTAVLQTYCYLMIILLCVPVDTGKNIPSWLLYILCAPWLILEFEAIKETNCKIIHMYPICRILEDLEPKLDFNFFLSFNFSLMQSSGDFL